MLESTCNNILEFFCRRRYYKFLNQNNNLENIQKEILEKILKESFEFDQIDTLQDFQAKVPIVKYSALGEKINIAVATNQSITQSRVKYFQPTSGSTSKEKWIPYTASFLSELNNASLTWISDIYKNYPDVKKGKQYWSLSWLPEDIRHKRKNDDLEVLGFVERNILKNIMALPWDVSQFPTAHTSLLGTCIGLVNCEELSLISIWSPTYLLSILNFMSEHQNTIIDMCQNKNWGEFKDIIKFSFPKVSEKNLLIFKNWNGSDYSYLSKLWPRLSLISCWSSSTSTKWAQEIKKIFPFVSLQGKGLWATEGVVTIPFANKYPLAFHSHFYEFVDCCDGSIKFSWQLKKDDLVKPILTTGAGLYRYILEDRLKVTDFFGNVPCFEFLGRISEVDMVGEKISYEIAQEIMNEVELQFKIETFYFIADSKSTTPNYKLITKSNNYQDEVQVFVEKRLNDNFHYKVAREIGQLGCAEVFVVDDPLAFYKTIKSSKGMIDGNMKLEPLVEN